MARAARAVPRKKKTVHRFSKEELLKRGAARADKKKEKKGPKLPPPGPPVPPRVASPEDKQIVQDYLSGKINPEPGALPFLIDQLRVTIAEGEAVRKNIGQIEQQLAILQQRFLEVGGASNQTALTILHFHKELNKEAGDE